MQAPIQTGKRFDAKAVYHEQAMSSANLHVCDFEDNETLPLI
jgi:hypothetical protein